MTEPQDNPPESLRPAASAAPNAYYPDPIAHLGWIGPALPAPIDARTDALLTPARRAAVLSVVIGIGSIALAVCIFAVGFTLKHGTHDPAMAAAFQKIHEQWPDSAGIDIATACFVAAAGAAVAGFVYLILAAFVVRASVVAIILAGILSIGLLLILTMNGIASLVTGQGDSAIVALILAAPLVFLLRWLAQSFSVASRVRQTRLEWEHRRWAPVRQTNATGFSAYFAPVRPAPRSIPPTESVREK